MQTARNHKLAQPGNRRTGPVMLAAFILLAIAIGFIGSLPTSAQVDSKAVGAVRLESNQPGVLDVSWDAPTDTPRDYRVNWARVGENFPTWTDSSGNAFPTTSSYTITGLDQGVRYKVKVRARYDGPPGAWSGIIEAVVASAAPTATPIPANTATTTSTATATSIPANTATPTPTATATSIPANTATPTPTLTQADSKAVGAVRVESNQASELEVSWDAPTDTPRDYRVNWARVGENFPTWTDSSGNAFPTTSSYTITGLDQDVRYKVKVRARYDGPPGDWSGIVEAVVASVASTATPTATVTTVPVDTATTSPTATATSIPVDTATSTSTATATAMAVVPVGPLTGFTVVDASIHPQTVLTTLTDGGTLTLDDPANGSYGIQVNTDTGVQIGSVRLQLTGAKSVDQTEGISPYSLYGDNGDGALHGQVLPVGDYTLTATAYSEANRGGNLLGTLEVSFTVAAANTPATTTPTATATSTSTPELLVGDSTTIVFLDDALTATPTATLVFLESVTLSDTPKPTATPTVTTTTVCTDAASDKAALTAFYNATGGANWTVKTNWLSAEPLGAWHGVTTDDSGCVTGLILKHNELSGSIPTELGSLANLTTLNLSRDNQLTGSIPTELGNLVNLTTLRLSHNQLTGSIPTELGSLVNLTTLHLGGNQLSGSIPTELGSLVNLTTLHLGDNQLTASIPTELGSLANLTWLYLHTNQLSGSIPTDFGSLVNLMTLHLGDNQLTGSIPTELGSLANLTWLYLHTNQLSGCIPASLRSVSNTDLDSLGLAYCDGATPTATVTPNP